MRRVVGILIGVGILAFGGWIFWSWQRSTGFKVLSTSPRNGATDVTLTEPIEITFNRPLDPEMIDRVAVLPSVSGETKVDGKKLIFKPSLAYQTGTHYRVFVSDPLSNDGYKMDNYELSFTVKYRDYVDLTSDEKKRQAERTDRLESADPVLKILPYETTHFKLDYRSDSASQFHLLITLYANGKTEDEYRAVAIQYRDEALAWLRSRGFDPAKYKIEYDPPLN